MKVNYLHFNKIILIFLTLVVIPNIYSCRPRGYNFAEVKGYPLTLRMLKNDYVAHNSPPSEDELAKYIMQRISKNKYKSKRNKIYRNLATFYNGFSAGEQLDQPTKYKAAQSLAKDILFNAKCFHLDPYYFTGLIQTESIYFDPFAQSPTNAVGITQFTSLALLEANHQLGQFGIKKAKQEAIFFYNKIFTNCIRPNWHPLWNRGSVYRQLRVLKTNPSIALTYGALIFHENLSLSGRGRTRKPVDLYRKAFNRYNASAEYTGNTDELLAHARESFYAADKLRKLVNKIRKENGGTQVKLLPLTGKVIAPSKSWFSF